MALSAKIVWNVTDYCEARFGSLDTVGQFFRTPDGLGMAFRCHDGCCEDFFPSKKKFLQENKNRKFYRIDLSQ